MSKDYEGKAVFVTGAGVGIGYGIVKAFAEAGATVALNDMDNDLAEQSANAINTAIGAERVLPYACDIAETDAIQNAINTFAAQQDRLDIVIANAGITNYGAFLDYTPEAFDRLVGVNLRGTYFTAQAAARQMIVRNTENGRIVLMSSVTGKIAFPYLSAYGMTKAAIRHLAKVLALEVGKHGITVNAICPGAIVTERTLADDPNFEENWQSVTPNGRVGYVEDIVNAALFLAAPASRHVSGQTLVVDGDWAHTSPVPEAAPDLPEESSKLR